MTIPYSLAGKSWMSFLPARQSTRLRGIITVRLIRPVHPQKKAISASPLSGRYFPMRMDTTAYRHEEMRQRKLPRRAFLLFLSSSPPSKFPTHQSEVPRMQKPMAANLVQLKLALITRSSRK